MEIKVLASGSSGNCYILQAEGNSIMLECGIPIKRIREGGGFRLHEIQACLVSHSH